MSEPRDAPVALSTIVREWGRIGLIGFGGPPAHIALFRRLCVEERAWLTAHDFEDGIAATNLLPGPASTQLAIYCAWRLRGRLGAIIGGLCFILPGLAMILALSALFLSAHPPLWVLGAAAGAGAAVPAVALNAALGLLPASWRRAGTGRGVKVRWIVYFLAGGVSAATVGAFLVLVLIVCGAVEIVIRTRGTGVERRGLPGLIPMTALPVVTGGLAALCLGGPQGRCPFLRGRVRHHPAHAARCRDHLPLDDGSPVPQRRSTRTGHTWSSGPDGGRRGLRSQRAMGWPVGGWRGVCPVVRIHHRRSDAISIGCAPIPECRPSSSERDQP